MSITVSAVQRNFSGTPGTVFNTASSTPTAAVSLFTVFGSGASITAATPPSLSGNGRTWTFVGAKQFLDPFGSPGQYLYMFRGTGTPSAGAVTITFSSTVDVAGWTHAEASGTYPPAVVQFGGANGDSSAALVTLNTFLTGTNSATYSVLILNDNTGITAGTGFTELGEFGLTGFYDVFMQDQWRNDADTSVTADWAGGDRQWAMVAVELSDAKPALVPVGTVYEANQRIAFQQRYPRR